MGMSAAGSIQARITRADKNSAAQNLWDNLENKLWNSKHIFNMILQPGRAEEDVIEGCGTI